MSINITSVYQSNGVYGVKNVSGAKKTNRAEKSETSRDTFTLSTFAEDFQIARKAVYAVPDIRADKVNTIKARMDAGTYSVSGKDIAAKILAGAEE